MHLDIRTGEAMIEFFKSLTRYYVWPIASKGFPDNNQNGWSTCPPGVSGFLLRFAHGRFAVIVLPKMSKPGYSNNGKQKSFGVWSYVCFYW